MVKRTHQKFLIISSIITILINTEIIRINSQPPTLSEDFILNNETKTERAELAHKEVMQTLNQIFRSLPNSKPVLVSYLINDKYAYLGEYDNKHLKIILYNTGQSEYEITETHEIGHWLNIVLSPNKHQLASDIDPELNNWWDAVTNSWKYKKFQKGFLKVNQDKHKKDNVYYFVFKYALNKDELFARSFTQYATEKSQNMNMELELSKVKNLPDGLQWDDKDFQPIYVAMGNYFKTKGILKGQ